MTKMSNNIKQIKLFIKNNQERILFFGIIILVALISFRAGELKEREQQSSDIKVFLNNSKELTEEDKKALALGIAVQRKGLTEDVEEIRVDKDAKNEEDCKFIGSKNSDKYHTLDCQWAKRIKEENRVCFKNKKKQRLKDINQGVATSSIKYQVLCIN